MDDTQKWVAGVGATVLIATLAGLGWVLAINRADNNAMEARLGSKLDELARKIDDQNARLRQTEIDAAVSKALAHAAIQTGSNFLVRRPVPETPAGEKS